jgi:hypothetical protein
MKKPFYQKAYKKLRDHIDNVDNPRVSLINSLHGFNRGHTGVIGITRASAQSGGFVFIPDGVSNSNGLLINLFHLPLLLIPSIGLYEGVTE